MVDFNALGGRALQLGGTLANGVLNNPLGRVMTGRANVLDDDGGNNVTAPEGFQSVIPQFDTDPLGAIGFIAGEVQRGIQGKPSEIPELKAQDEQSKMLALQKQIMGREIAQSFIEDFRDIPISDVERQQALIAEYQNSFSGHGFEIDFAAMADDPETAQQALASISGINPRLLANMTFQQQRDLSSDYQMLEAYRQISARESLPDALNAIERAMDLAETDPEAAAVLNRVRQDGITMSEIREIAPMIGMQAWEVDALDASQDEVFPQLSNQFGVEFVSSRQLALHEQYGIAAQYRGGGGGSSRGPTVAEYLGGGATVAASGTTGGGSATPSVDLDTLGGSTSSRLDVGPAEIAMPAPSQGNSLADRVAGSPLANTPIDDLTQFQQEVLANMERTGNDWSTAVGVVGDSREAKIADLMASQNLDRGTAAALVDGQIDTAVNPQDGSIITIDQRTGQVTARPVGSQFEREEAAGESSIPEGFSLESATGGEGVALNILSGITDAIGLGDVSAANTETTQFLTNLAVRTEVALAAPITGRPTNYLMEKLASLTVSPNELFEGPVRSLERMRQTRALIATEIDRMERRLARGGLSPTNTQEMEDNLSVLYPLQRDYDAVFGAVTQGVEGPVATRPDTLPPPSGSTAPAEIPGDPGAATLPTLEQALEVSDPEDHDRLRRLWPLMTDEEKRSWAN